MLSDFFDTEYEKLFKNKAKRHDVIPVVFNDPLEMSILDHKGFFISIPFPSC